LRHGVPPSLDSSSGAYRLPINNTTDIDAEFAGSEARFINDHRGTGAYLIGDTFFIITPEDSFGWYARVQGKRAMYSSFLIRTSPNSTWSRSMTFKPVRPTLMASRCLLVRSLVRSLVVPGDELLLDYGEEYWKDIDQAERHMQSEDEEFIGNNSPMVNRNVTPKRLRSSRSSLVRSQLF
jgi:hypothetical protein